MEELAMDVWLEWAMGPLFWTALTFMIFGLLRHLGLTVWEGAQAYRRAGDKDIPLGKVTGATLKWLIPLDRLGNRWLFSLTTLLFHLGVILVPLFLAGHIALWREGVGLSWPAIPNGLATLLTWVVILSALAVVIQRVAARDSRTLSRFQDYALPLFIAVPFLSGFLVMHPAWNPFERDPTLLVHVLSADLLIFLVPLTKLSHMILMPFTQLVSELAWHFPPDAGTRVAVTLGKENEPI
jgi:nitrate reductase gamma subunit